MKTLQGLIVFYTENSSPKVRTFKNRARLERFAGQMALEEATKVVKGYIGTEPIVADILALAIDKKGDTDGTV